MKNSCWECPNRPRWAPIAYNRRGELKNEIFQTFSDNLDEGEEFPHPVIKVVADVCESISMLYSYVPRQTTITDWHHHDASAKQMIEVTYLAVSELAEHPRKRFILGLLNMMVTIVACDNAGKLGKARNNVLDLIDWTHRGSPNQQGKDSTDR